MAFDRDNLQKLQDLARRLPSPLPVPEPTPRQQSGSGSVKGHPIETETDPARLFQQLMQASPDGQVPPHLLERLRHLEDARRAAKPHTVEGKRGTSRARPRTETAQPDSLYVAFEQLLLEDDELRED